MDTNHGNTHANMLKVKWNYVSSNGWEEYRVD